MNCKHCNKILIGGQKKYCSETCKKVWHINKNRKTRLIIITIINNWIFIIIIFVFIFMFYNYLMYKYLFVLSE